MAADKGGTESVLLGREMGGDQGKNIRWYAVYGNEGVHPLADGRQCSRGVIIQGESTRDVVSVLAGEATVNSLTMESTP